MARNYVGDESEPDPRGNTPIPHNAGGGCFFAAPRALAVLVLVLIGRNR